MAVKPADLTARLFPHESSLRRIIGAGCCQGLGDDLTAVGIDEAQFWKGGSPAPARPIGPVSLLRPLAFCSPPA
ncbi:MAG: hypothetical protein QGH37_12990 [Candidatus Poribacteria bacterium]|jgi:hypothetical protein|nr:hypothetical protein [Candidatus Poribacteria bacterium]MDP6960807.1 hypothetical protein [Dehalococcoidia bacterium]